EDFIRHRNVTGVQTCALPISLSSLSFLLRPYVAALIPKSDAMEHTVTHIITYDTMSYSVEFFTNKHWITNCGKSSRIKPTNFNQIGRASSREKLFKLDIYCIF